MAKNHGLKIDCSYCGRAYALDKITNYRFVDGKIMEFCSPQCRDLDEHFYPVPAGAKKSGHGSHTAKKTVAGVNTNSLTECESCKGKFKDDWSWRLTRNGVVKKFCSMRCKDQFALNQSKPTREAKIKKSSVENRPHSSILNCVICGRSSAPQKVLSSGKNYHQSCYQELLKEWQGLNEAVVKCRDSFLQQKRQRSQLESELSSVFSFFKRPALNKELTEVRLAVAKSQAALEQARGSAAKFDVNRLESLWDFWLTYPPDWDTRRSEFLEGRKCEECGTQRGLQAHHIMPLSRGGSNLSSNFAALCRECHEDHHHGFKEGGSSGSLFSRHLEIITDAISSQTKVVIRYKAANRDKTKRIISPLELISLEFAYADGESLCVKAYCELRGAERVFAIRRITKVERLN